MGCSLGVISHPDDEDLAKTLNERLYDIAFKRPQSHLNVISINATSSKDSLKKGKEFICLFFFFFFTNLLSFSSFLSIFFLISVLLLMKKLRNVVANNSRCSWI